MKLFLILSLISQILPERIVTHPGDSVRLNIKAKNVKRIQVIPPAIGIVKNGYFYALKKGDGVIKVVFKDRPPAYSYVKVAGENRRFEIKISPRRVELNPGDTIKFSLKSPSDGSCFVNWRVVPSWIGKISLTGEFVAGTRSGKGKIIAIVRCGRKRGLGFASVSVGNSSKFVPVEIQPDPVYVDRNRKVTLRVLPGVSSYDSVDWIVEPEKLGFVNERQEFVPLQSRGRGVIWFTAWKDDSIYTGKALVFIGRPPRLISIDRFVIAPGETCRISARPPRRLKRRLKDADFRWSVKPEWLGEFLNDRSFPETRFVAGTTPGSGIIFVEVDGRPINFTKTPVIVGKTTVNITPRSVYLKIGETVRFETDRQVNGTWRVFPEFAGRIDGNGNFTAEVPLREVFIIFEVTEPGGGGGIAKVTILPETAD